TPRGEVDELARRLLRLGERAEAEELEPGTDVGREATAPPLVEERERLRRVEVVVEHCREALLLLRLAARGRVEEEVPKRVGLRLRLRERLVAVVERLAPVAGHEEKQQVLAPPPVERLLQGDVVAYRLVHLFAAEA